MNAPFKTALLCSALAAPLAAQADDITIAFLAASSQNGFNQSIYAGIEEAAAKYDDVSVEIFDGAFSATTQFSQVEDLVAGGRFDGMIVTPNDTVGIATALEDAVAQGMSVAATLFPIGPELSNMEPQVEGLTTTIAADPSVGAREQAEAVAAYCADIDPCKVVVIVGQLIFPFDNLRNDTYEEVFAQHPNIQVVATGEGNYSPATSMVAMQDILQANPDIDAVLGSADQHLMGAEIALTDAGIDTAEIFTIGGGLNQIVVDGIRAGTYDATMAQFPHTMGAAALDALVSSLRGEDVPTWIDEYSLRDVPVIVDREWLEANPDFDAEWQG
ncbi:monosaccharide ABC transporter substrate-binding protein (CUT2 family) [Pseudoroseicyclus aestuarii]|uniref:Monosaccharide ABC transporter substrate-binding protein (CUT2 family) n=2 Tax=Pseudoroseicyclus aestuarii TaxID=1795041 RepID=A0A318SYM9_9RHOB|nr:monosaccharide ABC transporter substrate-binding protein (CUT2 family) [Pseudoroseicyclus aestuarii]